MRRAAGQRFCADVPALPATAPCRGSFMLAAQFAAAAASARTVAALDDVSRLAWRAHAEGHLDERGIAGLAEAAEARRAVLRSFGQPKPSQPPAPAAKPSRPISPDRAASLARRRRLAASGALPPQLAACFTQGEVAALAVIAREVQRRGGCELPLDAIAALAGVSRTTVQNAVRAALAIGALARQERRRRGRKSDTNIFAITDAGWRAWLRLSGNRVQKPERHEYQNKNQSNQKGIRGAELWRSRSVRGTMRRDLRDVSKRPPCEQQSACIDGCRDSRGAGPVAAHHRPDARPA